MLLKGHWHENNVSNKHMGVLWAFNMNWYNILNAHIKPTILKITPRLYKSKFYSLPPTVFYGGRPEPIVCNRYPRSYLPLLWGSRPEKSLFCYGARRRRKIGGLIVPQPLVKLFCPGSSTHTTYRVWAYGKWIKKVSPTPGIKFTSCPGQ
jgi:hypothetical protein